MDASIPVEIHAESVAASARHGGGSAHLPAQPPVAGGVQGESSSSPITKLNTKDAAGPAARALHAVFALFAP